MWRLYNELNMDEDNINRRTMLRSVGMTGAVLAGVTGLSSSAGAESRETALRSSPTARARFFERQTTELRKGLSEAGYLERPDVSQFDLATDIGKDHALEAARDVMGFHVLAPSDSDVDLGVSHTTDEYRMAIFVKEDPAESHAVIEDGHDEVLFKASSGAVSTSSDTISVCNFACETCRHGGQDYGRCYTWDIGAIPPEIIETGECGVGCRRANLDC